MDELKTIVSAILKVDPSEINEQTVIDRSAIPGSILIHRMYAAIKSSGYRIDDYTDIKYFGQLLGRIGLPSTQVEHADVNPDKARANNENWDGLQLLGVDLESISNFPDVPDFREDEFYSETFAKSEISHALLASRPLEVFAGLFCAKEAICKADNTYRSTPFKDLLIEHSVDGAPVFNGFSISISHNDEFAVAVALKANVPIPDSETDERNQNHTEIISDYSSTDLIHPENATSIPVALMLSVFALIISLLALILIIVRWS